jgi:hypothetical protein
MKLLSPAQKGLITGSLIIALSAAVYAIYKSFDNPVHLGAYALYAVGIFWALHDFNRAAAPEDKTFKNYFAQGFKCFIVVTLMMVCANFLFLQLNTAFKAEMIENVRAELLKNPDYTAGDVEKQITNYKNFVVPAFVMSTVFAYLGVGALISVLATIFFKYIKN